MTIPATVRAVVAVIIPCRNEAAFLPRLLDRLAAQTRVPDQVIVVDDQSTDGSAEIVREWSSTSWLDVRLIAGSGRGPAAAVNTGVRSTAADCLIRLDGHSQPAVDYVERCLTLIDRGVVGGRWVIRPGAPSIIARAIAAVVSHPLGSGGAAYRSRVVTDTTPHAVETVPFGAYRRSVWCRLGGLDESLVVNEDFDFNYRARQAGYEVLLDPAMVVEYFARPTLNALARQYARYGFWKFIMLRKDARAWHWRQLLPASVWPWLIVSTSLAFVMPHPLTFAAAWSYPVVVAVGGVAVGVQRRVNPVAVTAAAMVVHVCWSLGFWTAAIRAAWRQLVRT